MEKPPQNKQTKPKQRSGFCPKCGSTNVATEPIYDEEEGLVSDQIALFCLTCGHYLGEVESSLHERMETLRSELTDFLYKKD